MQKHQALKSILLGIVFFVLFLLAIVGVWVLYSTLDKKENLSVIPPEFAAYVRTDHLWKSAEPLVDVKAIDVFLADPKMGAARNAIMSLRSSDLRTNKWIAIAADRRVDAAFYSDGSFAACIEMGPLSAATRLAPRFVKLLSVKGLSYVTSEQNSWFQYESGKTVVYVKPYHNLVIAASSRKIFEKMCGASCLDSYTPERKMELAASLNAPFRIACDVNTVLAFDESVSYNVAPVIEPLLKKNALAFVDTAITDRDMHLELSFPLAKTDASYESISQQNAKIAPETLQIAAASSQKTTLIEKLPNIVQYYTLLNVAPLQQLCGAAMPLIPASKNVPSLWNKGEGLCKMLFSLSIEDLLFSWTGKEIAVLGLEGKKDPVFVMQVVDEQKRQDVFKSVFSSLVVNENDSLLLDGVRVPRIELPSFLQDLLGAFNVRIAKPYYVVSNGFAYFSESAENIVQIASASENEKLIHAENYKAVSSLQKKELSMSLYYNLERSMPFFLKSESSLSKALQLYNIGRADVRIERTADGEGTFIVSLQASSRENTQRTAVPGYPITLDGKQNTQFCRNTDKKPQLLFWVQDLKTVQLYSADSSESASFECKNNAYITPSAKETKQGVLWTACADGTIYLFDKKLAIAPNFPILLNKEIEVKPVLYKNMLLVATAEGTFTLINADGTTAEVSISYNGKIKAAPTVLDGTVAFYAKSLSGSLVIVSELGTAEQQVVTIPVTGIGFGSPALIANNNETLSPSAVIVAFITQSGTLSLYDGEGNILPSFPVEMEKVYYGNAVTNGKSLYVLSADAALSRIDIDGTMLSVQIPDLTAKVQTLSFIDYNDDGTPELFVNGDSNMIYAFTEKLELIQKFPVAGMYAPVFADLDGDRKNECLTVSLDNKLNAYKVLKNKRKE